MKKLFATFLISLSLLTPIYYANAVGTIAFDAATSGGLTNPGTSQIWSHTCSGTNRILFVEAFNAGGGDILTGVTYAGVAMTLVNKVTIDSQSTQLFYLVAPATGTNNVVVSYSASTIILSNASSYTGANQSGQPDASTTHSGQVAANNNFTTTLTTIADNSWTILASRENSSASEVASTGSTQRVLNNGGTGIYDSNGAITPAGSYSMSVKVGQTADWMNVMASFAPYTPPSAVIPSLRWFSWF
jgi:hypothetical protein